MKRPIFSIVLVLKLLVVGLVTPVKVVARIGAALSSGRIMIIS
jgi:hypothetical protein